MSRFIDLTGKRFGKLVVLKLQTIENYPCGQKKEIYLCKCDCGNHKLVTKRNLLCGNTNSCGCLKNIAYNFSHKQSKTRLYDIWIGIKTRCYNKNSKSYKYYGARGIKVCDEWLNDFISFHNWAINNGYKDNLSIDRINSNGNYEPNNCRWADNITQANNTRKNRYITHCGETHTLAEWARKLNKNYKLLHKKISKGMSFEKAITMI